MPTTLHAIEGKREGREERREGKNHLTCSEFIVLPCFLLFLLLGYVLEHGCSLHVDQMVSENQNIYQTLLKSTNFLGLASQVSNKTKAWLSDLKILGS